MNGEVGVPQPPRAEIRSLLSAIFRSSACDHFIVLRNAEMLPADLAGTDLDVVPTAGCASADVVAYLRDVTRATGWEVAMASVRPHMTAVGLVSTTPGVQLAAMHFDIFDGISCLGLPLISTEDLALESVVRDGVRYLSERAEVLSTVVHHLTWNGSLGKEKYRSKLQAVIANEEDGAWLQRNVTSILGGRVADRLEQWSMSEADRSQQSRRRRSILASLLLRRSVSRPFTTLRQLATYALGQAGSFAHPPGMVGSEGDRLPHAPSVHLTLEVACGLAPHGFGIRSVRSPESEGRTTNGPRYGATLRRRLRRTRPIRFLTPTLYLWTQAKRGRVVVVDSLPLAIRLLQRTRRRPEWICIPRTGLE